MIFRLLSVRHLGLKLAAAVTLDLAALTVLRSRRFSAWCDRVDAALSDEWGDE